jgi:hypothetical protein
MFSPNHWFQQLMPELLKADRIVSIILECHRQGVVHGDLHVRNIIFPFSAPLECVLLDFGFAFDPSNPCKLIGGNPAKRDVSTILGLLGHFFGEWETLLWMEKVGPIKSQDTVWRQAMLATRGFKDERMWCPIEDREWKIASNYHLDRETRSDDPELAAMFISK